MEQVGRGSVGTVYRARDVETGAMVAVKVFDGYSSDMEGPAFRRDADVVAAIVHPHLVRYHGHSAEDEETPYLVMEWLDAEPLDGRLARRELTAREAVDLARRVAAALGALHARGIVHRNLHPHNLLLQGGDPARVKLSDLGVDPSPERLVQVIGRGPTALTAGFLAPEYAKTGHADARTDVFALGAVLFRCLAGCLAFAGDDAAEVMSDVLQARPAPEVSAVRSDLPQALCDLVARMLAKKAADRPADGGAVARALAGLGDLGKGGGALPRPGAALPKPAPSATTHAPASTWTPPPEHVKAPVAAPPPPPREPGRPSVAVLRGIAGEALAPLLAACSGDERRRRADAVGALFDDRAPSGGSSVRCALCEEPPMGRRHVVVQAPADRRSSLPSFTVVDGDRGLSDPAICAVCTDKDWATRDADAEAALEVLRQPTAEMDVVWARKELEERIARRQVRTIRGVPCSFCDEDGETGVRSRHVTVCRFCWAELRRALGRAEDVGAPEGASARERRRREDEEQDRRARGIAREYRWLRRNALVVRAELEEKRRDEDARALARMPEWKRREAQATRTAQEARDKPPAPYEAWRHEEETWAANMDAGTFDADRDLPFPPELVAEAHRFAAWIGARRARVLPSPPERPATADDERVIELIEQAAINGYRLRDRRGGLYGRRVVDDRWQIIEPHLAAHPPGPGLRLRVDAALWLLQRALALGVRYHDSYPRYGLDAAGPDYLDITYRYANLVGRLHDYRRALPQRGNLLLHGGTVEERQEIAAELHDAVVGADAYAAARFVVVGPGDGPLTSSLRRDTVHVPDVFALSRHEQRLLVDRLDGEACTVFGADDLEPFAARARAELLPPLGERITAPAYDVTEER